MLGPSSPWRPLAVLPLWTVLGLTVQAQAPAPVPADLPVTRLQGAGPGPAQVPQGPQPPRPGDLSPLPATRLADAAGADLDGPRRIALALARPMPLRDMLLLLVNGTPFSLVTDESVDGTFVGDLKDLSMRQALEAVLFPRGLDYDVQGRLIRVFAHRPETRLFDVNLLDERRAWNRETGGRTAGVSTSGVADRVAQLEQGIRGLLSDTGRVHVDRGSGLVQVTDFAERLDRVGVYVEAVQLRSLRQVRIDARVIEVTLKEAGAGGIDWKAAAARAGAAPAAGTGLAVTDPAALLKAVAEQGTVTVLAAPQVVAMNNEPAVMRVGTRRAYFETTEVPGAGGRARRTAAASTVLEGLTLSVTPQIAGDGSVQLSVAPSYTEKTGDVKSRQGDSHPVMRVSEADTVLRLQDGHTAVIAGFLQGRTRPRPATGLASYFGAQSQETVTSELVILLTPAIVTPAGAGPSGR